MSAAAAGLADVGDLLRRRREQHGVSQVQLALRAGTSQQALSRIERGEVSSSIDTLERLLAAMGEELVLEVRPRELPFALEDLARAARQPMAERLERGLSWNRFAGRVAAAGARERG